MDTQDNTYGDYIFEGREIDGRSLVTISIDGLMFIRRAMIDEAMPPEMKHAALEQLDTHIRATEKKAGTIYLSGAERSQENNSGRV